MWLKIILVNYIEMEKEQKRIKKEISIGIAKQQKMEIML